MKHKHINEHRPNLNLNIIMCPQATLTSRMWRDPMHYYFTKNNNKIKNKLSLNTILVISPDMLKEKIN